MKAARLLKTQAGFSLIELMIVVAIIGILASIAVPNFQKFQRRAKQTEGKGYLTSIYTAEQGFRAEWNTYATDLRCIGFRDDTITGAGVTYTQPPVGIAGRGNYAAGFNADTIPAPTGTACVAGGNYARPAGASGTTIPTALPAPTGMPAISASTFTAVTAGDLSNGALANDVWVMSHEKVVKNQVSGI